MLGKLPVKIEIAPMSKKIRVKDKQESKLNADCIPKISPKKANLFHPNDGRKSKSNQKMCQHYAKCFPHLKHIYDMGQ